LRRREPVGPEIAGYDCDQGWWKNKQEAANRDWDIWADMEIGPQK